MMKLCVIFFHCFCYCFCCWWWWIPPGCTGFSLLPQSTTTKNAYAYANANTKRFANVVVPVMYDSSNDLHRCIQYHPEQPARIEACVAALQQEYPTTQSTTTGSTATTSTATTKTTASSTSSSMTRVDLQDMKHVLTEDELEYAKSILSTVHSEPFVSQFQDKCYTSRQRRIDEGKQDPLGFVGYIDQGDTYVTTETFDVCLRATAIWIRAVNSVMIQLTNTVTTTSTAWSLPSSSSSSSTIASAASSSTSSSSCCSMALTRPPGHHATKEFMNGFCLFNFAAAATVHALQQYSQQQYSTQPQPQQNNNNNNKKDFKISILDWDVHYGQGVVDIVQEYNQVRYVSIHQRDAFPFMMMGGGGSDSTTGTPAELSGPYQNIMTIPIPADTTWTCGYESVYTKYALPFVYTKGEWEPSLIIVCAGYDALDSDELASVSLQAQDFGEMTRLLRQRINNTTTAVTTTTKTTTTTTSNHHDHHDDDTAENTNHDHHHHHHVGIVIGMEGGYQLKQSVGGGNLVDAVLETVKALL